MNTDGEIEQNGTISVKVEILRPIANPREELDKLVGCDDIKRRMDELVALTSYNKMMRELFPDNKQHEVSLHSVFLGRPGTGKTTVCKIFGSLLRKAGAHLYPTCIPLCETAAKGKERLAFTDTGGHRSYRNPSAENKNRILDGS